MHKHLLFVTGLMETRDRAAWPCGRGPQSPPPSAASPSLLDAGTHGFVLNPLTARSYLVRLTPGKNPRR